jgi:hypothetical protein
VETGCGDGALGDQVFLSCVESFGVGILMEISCLYSDVSA